MPLQTIISGGQTGVDLAALVVAKKLGFKTGGWMPYGFLTTAGPRPDLAEAYGMWEHDSPRYAPRTAKNIEDSHGTLLIYRRIDSPGTKLTIEKARSYKRPLLEVNLSRPISAETAVDFITLHGIATLNVAGNSERTWPEIGGEAAEWMLPFLNLAIQRRNQPEQNAA